MPGITESKRVEEVVWDSAGNPLDRLFISPTGSHVYAEHLLKQLRDKGIEAKIWWGDDHLRSVAVNNVNDKNTSNYDYDNMYKFFAEFPKAKITNLKHNPNRHPEKITQEETEKIVVRLGAEEEKPKPSEKLSETFNQKSRGEGVLKSAGCRIKQDLLQEALKEIDQFVGIDDAKIENQRDYQPGEISGHGTSSWSL